MDSINFKREIADTVDNAIERATRALGAEGFGILTRIDMHSKIKEKTGKDIIPTVILGACNPNLAYEAYTANTDVASLLPCNAVIREVAPGQCVEHCEAVHVGHLHIKEDEVRAQLGNKIRSFHAVRTLPDHRYRAVMTTQLDLQLCAGERIIIHDEGTQGLAHSNEPSMDRMSARTATSHCDPAASLRVESTASHTGMKTCAL